MTRIIPRELIRHFEWSPGQEIVQPEVVPTLQQAEQRTFSIEALINSNQVFYSNKKEDGKWIGVAVALEEAEKKMATENGIIPSLPYLIAGKSVAEKENYLWKNWFTALSEENVGIDQKGKFVDAGKPVVITVHGGGILTSERIKKAYSEGLTPQNAAKYTPEEFNNLLTGSLPSGESIQIYSVDDVINGNIPEPFGRYAVWLDLETAQEKSSGYQQKSDFMDNKLVLVRAGTLEYLDNYFEKAQHSKNKNVGNWHRLNEIDPAQPQGRVLFLLITDSGLYGGNSLGYSGRFIGVAPEAHK